MRLANRVGIGIRIRIGIGIRIGIRSGMHIGIRIGARRPSTAVAALAVCALAACTVGPDYHRPSVPTPSDWQTDSYWQQGTPTHAPLSLDWWQVFDDPVLNRLETRGLLNNPTLQAASAHYEQAKALLAQTFSAALPEVDVNAGAARVKSSGQRPQQNYATPVQSTVQNDLTLRAGISYELDLFGRVRRDIESGRATVAGAQDDLANARLVLTADLASTYFSLREIDIEIDIVQRSIRLQEQALDYVNARHELGAVSGLDVAQQQSELDGTRTQAQLLKRQRAQYADAIAAIIGTPAPSFQIASTTPPMAASSADGGPVSPDGMPKMPTAQTAMMPVTTMERTLPVPHLPLTLPSTVLQRRPDVAAAERGMAAANAQIGVAKAAYFPDVTLSPSIGWESTRFATMLSAPALMWSVGASAAQIVFDGGRRRAGVLYAQAGYDVALANYRETVLTAFQQVQDAVTGLSVLNGASQQAAAAAQDAQKLLGLASDRYSGGLAAYIDVINAQETLLNSQRQQVQIRGQQAGLVVYLAKALGGGWQVGAPDSVS